MEKSFIEGQGEKTGKIQYRGFKRRSPAGFRLQRRNGSRKRGTFQFPAKNRRKRLCRTGFPARLAGRYRDFELLKGDIVRL
jgi:hypothetical protein